MNSTKPLILIDFDGVFNAVGQLDWQARWPDMQESVFVDRRGYKIPIIFSPTVVSFFHDISSDAEIMWLTTWKSDTELLPVQFQFPQFPWLREIKETYWGSWWKADIVATFPESRRTLWIDDEIPTYHDSEEQKMIQRRKGNLQTLIPAESVGLTPEHLELIRAFISG